MKKYIGVMVAIFLFTQMGIALAATPDYKNFSKGIVALRTKYITEANKVRVEYVGKIQAVYAGWTTLKAQKQAAIDTARTTYITEARKEVAKINALRADYTKKLTDAQKAFQDKYMLALKEKRYSDLAGIVKEYQTNTANINKKYVQDQKDLSKKVAENMTNLRNTYNTAVANAETTFNNGVKKIQDDVLKLRNDQKLDMGKLRAIAEGEIKALCTKYGVSYSDYYLTYVFPYEYSTSANVASPQAQDPKIGEPPVAAGPDVTGANANVQVPPQADKKPNVPIVPQMGGTPNNKLNGVNPI